MRMQQVVALKATDVENAGRVGAPSSATSDSSDTSDDSSLSNESSDLDSSDSDDSGQDEEQSGFAKRIANAIQAKQHQLMEARRHPVLEWKEAVRWDVEDAAAKALAEVKRQQREAQAAEKAGIRERKEKRRAQRKLNKRKEQEFRVLLQGYDEQLTRSNKRAELLTAFSIDTRAREKQRLAATQLAIKEEHERADKKRRMFFTVNLKRFKHTEEIRGEAIGDHGGVELARSLLTGACPRVKSIYLGWNHIKYAGIAALADCFVRGACSQLQVLDLRCNSIDARSFQELIDVLAKGGLPELLDLVLQGNVIGDEGAKAIAHAMLKGTLQALRMIDVRQNRIRNAGVQAIWNVFTSQCFKRYCPKLQLLDMRRNDASGTLTRSFCPCPPYLEF